MAGREYRFEIDAFTPETIPMGRLAEYMHEFATLLGQQESVHFKGLEAGSTNIVSLVEQEAIPKAQERVYKAERGEGPREPIEAIRNINRKLKEDNAVGAVKEKDTGAEIIRFVGREASQKITFGAFNQDGSLDGVVIVIGGTSDPVPVHIQSRDSSTVRICEASRVLAKALGHYLFGNEIRVNGTGRWIRDEHGQWRLERFKINGFDPLNEQPLATVVADLRSIPSEWTDVKNPWIELDRIRNGPREPK